MNKDRIEGIARQGLGKAKELAGDLVGDTKLQVDGKAEQAKGRLQNALGGLKDKLKG